MTKEFIVKVTDSGWPDGIHRFEEEYAPEQELIRCKDCKYWEEHHEWVRPEGGSYIAPRCNRLMKKSCSDWFCADGKGK